MSEFLEDLREHWHDHYWWADHQWLMMILLGVIGLGFHALNLWMDHAWGTNAGP